MAMDWKWLFIYPEQGIATVNELVLPVDVPVRFKITSTTVMNAFYVPELAGMIYAMPGMETELNAVQNKPVVVEGLSSNYSGAGFSDMQLRLPRRAAGRFRQPGCSRSRPPAARSTAPTTWQLEKPSVKEPVRHYGTVEPTCTTRS